MCFSTSLGQTCLQLIGITFFTTISQLDQIISKSSCFWYTTTADPLTFLHVFASTDCLAYVTHMSSLHRASECVFVQKTMTTTGSMCWTSKTLISRNIHAFSCFLRYVFRWHKFQCFAYPRTRWEETYSQELSRSLIHALLSYNVCFLDNFFSFVPIYFSSKFFFFQRGFFVHDKEFDTSR